MNMINNQWQCKWFWYSFIFASQLIDDGFFCIVYDLYRDAGVPSDVEAAQGAAELPHDPRHDAPGEHAGAGRGVLALGVQPRHHARAVAHDVAIGQTGDEICSVNNIIQLYFSQFT